ncbi:MAG: amidophosphoribosyltransferase [Candidatus Saccharimonadales bacterium]
MIDRPPNLEAGYEFRPPERDRKPQEECGVFGIYVPEAAHIANDVALGLMALQHRGEDAAGIAYSTNFGIEVLPAEGKVETAFSETTIRSIPETTIACGHVRYATSKGASHSRERNMLATQPIYKSKYEHEFAISMNGHLQLAPRIASEHGYNYNDYASDTDFLAQFMADRAVELGDIEKAVVDTMRTFKDNAFSLCIMTEDKLIAVRDPRGFRPLNIGELPSGGYVVASELSALDIIGANNYRSVEAGEMIVIDKNGKHSENLFEEHMGKLCVFEYIYTSRPDNELEGTSVYEARIRMGEELAKLYPIEADIVMGVPESGIIAAQGYHAASGIPLKDGFVKNRYVGRTFIQPSQALRESGVRTKLNPLRRNIQDQRLIVLDDSVIRGTTSRKAVRSLREAGAKEVHLLITSPPYEWPCYWGMDTDNPDELIARYKTVEEMAAYLEVDSLGFLPMDQLRTAIGEKAGKRICDFCFTGNQPTEVVVELGQPRKKNGLFFKRSHS